MTPSVPSLPRGPWLDLFAQRLHRLRPTASMVVLQTLATIAWLEAPELTPEEAVDRELAMPLLARRSA
jgi:hypothetical protein